MHASRGGQDVGGAEALGRALEMHPEVARGPAFRKAVHDLGVEGLAQSGNQRHGQSRHTEE